VEGIAQQVDSSIVGWMECVTVNSMWKVLHSRWIVVLWLEWSVLPWTVCGSYCTVGGQWYCGLNGMCYSEQYVEGTAQQVDCVIVALMECVTVKIILKLLHSRWTVILQLERSVLQWTICWNFGTTEFQNHKKYIYSYFEFCICLFRMCLILQCINATTTQVL